MFEARAGWDSDRVVPLWYEWLADVVGAVIEAILWACQVLPADQYEV